MKYISAFLQHRTNGWSLLVSTAIFAIFITVILPQQSLASAVYSKGVGGVDTRFYYTPGEVYQIAEAYGESGRRAYITARLTFDLVWPWAYAFFFGSLISFVFTRTFPSESRWQLANLVPVVGLCFDYAENLGISLIMAAFPLRLDGLAWATTMFTMLKWVFVNASFLIPAVGLGIWSVNRVRKR